MTTSNLSPDQIMRLHAEAARLRGRAAACLAESLFSRWLALGCPADRTGPMGWSLLDGPKTWTQEAPPP